MAITAPYITDIYITPDAILTGGDMTVQARVEEIDMYEVNVQAGQYYSGQEEMVRWP